MQEFIRTVALLSQEHPAIFFYAERSLIVFEKTSVDPHFRRDYRDFTKFCSVWKLFPSGLFSIVYATTRRVIDAIVLCVLQMKMW